jgi:hypothetical protein
MKQLSYNTGMIASMTTLTVLGVPVKGSSLDEMDSLLSILEVFEMLIHLSFTQFFNFIISLKTSYSLS